MFKVSKAVVRIPIRDLQRLAAPAVKMSHRDCRTSKRLREYSTCSVIDTIKVYCNLN